MYSSWLSWQHNEKSHTHTLHRKITLNHAVLKKWVCDCDYCDYHRNHQTHRNHNTHTKSQCVKKNSKKCDLAHSDFFLTFNFASQSKIISIFCLLFRASVYLRKITVNAVLVKSILYIKYIIMFHLLSLGLQVWGHEHLQAGYGYTLNL